MKVVIDVIDDIFIIKCLCRDDCIYCKYTGHFIKGHCPKCGHPEAKMLNPPKEKDKYENIKD